MLKIIKGHRDTLEQQMIDAIFQGKTKELITIQNRLSVKASISLIEPEHQTQVEPVSPHQSSEVPV